MELNICLLYLVEDPLHPEDLGKTKPIEKETLKLLILVFCFLYLPTFCCFLKVIHYVCIKKLFGVTHIFMFH